MDKQERRFEKLLRRQEKFQSKKLKKIQDKDLSARNPFMIYSKTREEAKRIKGRDEIVRKKIESKYSKAEAKQITTLKKSIPGLTKGQSGLISSAYYETKAPSAVKEAQTKFAEYKKSLPFKEKHPYLYAAKEEAKRTTRETLKRAGRALVKEVETIGKKRLRVGAIDKLTRPRFHPRERRLKYQPMASNILLAHSY